jgi:perosamine synthetase
MISVNEPALGAEELENVAECVRTGWISSGGRFVDEFEQGWAAYCGRRHGVAMCNGTAALQAAVAVLDLAPGDEVIMPTFTIISCALALVAAGATPVLVDSEPATWTMDVAQVRERVGERTRAVMPVHIYGHPVDLDPVLDLAEERGLAVIEDAAEAHGAEYQTRRGGESWRRAGSFGAMSTFSFYANKLVTTGEGGMVVTDDDDLAARLRGIRNLEFMPGRRFHHERLGHNFRLTNLQAAVGVPQIERMPETLQRKRDIAARYDQALAGLPVQLQRQEPWARGVYWMYGLVLDDAVDLDADRLAAVLRDDGVETRPFFLGMHEQPVLRRRGLFEGETYPVAERIARRGLYLPSGLGLTVEQQDAVVQAVGRALS